MWEKLGASHEEKEEQQKRSAPVFEQQEIQTKNKNEGPEIEKQLLSEDSVSRVLPHVETYLEHFTDTKVLSHQVGRVQLFIYSLTLQQHQTNRRQDKELENGNISPSPSPEQWLNKFYSTQENTLVIPSGNFFNKAVLSFICFADQPFKEGRQRRKKE